MKIDVCRPPAPPRPTAEVIIVLTEDEAREIAETIGRLALRGGTLTKFWSCLNGAVNSL